MNRRNLFKALFGAPVAIAAGSVIPQSESRITDKILVDVDFDLSGLLTPSEISKAMDQHFSREWVDLSKWTTIKCGSPNEEEQQYFGA